MRGFFIFLAALLLFAAGVAAGDRFGAPAWLRSWTGQAFGEGDRLVRESDRVFREGGRLAAERLEDARAYAQEHRLFAPPDDLTPEAIRDVLREAMARDADDGEPSAPFDDVELVDQAMATERLAAAEDTLIPLCPKMTIANAPASKDGVVTAPTIIRRGAATLNIVVAPGSCLSSGFGSRSGKLHKGIDFYHPQGVPVIAAGPGRIAEAGYREDYGNYVLIDHREGLATRYAHLRALALNVAPGARVEAGDNLGFMGNTASYQIPIHLHFELLAGDLDNPKGAFGLEPIDPFGG